MDGDGGRRSPGCSEETPAGRWAARGAALQSSLNSLALESTAALAMDSDAGPSAAGGGDWRGASAALAEDTWPAVEETWPPTAMSLSSDRLPYSFKLLHQKDLPSPRWQAHKAGPTPKPHQDYPTVPGMPGWAREPLLRLPEPEPEPYGVGMGFRERIGGEALLDYLGDVLQPGCDPEDEERLEEDERQLRRLEAKIRNAVQANRVQLTIAFDQGDSDESGTLDVQDLAAILAEFNVRGVDQRHLKQILGSMDDDGEAGVSYEEFLKYFTTRKELDDAEAPLDEPCIEGGGKIEDDEAEGMPRGTIARARWVYRRNKLKQAMAKLEPEPEPEPDPDHVVDPQPEPEVVLNELLELAQEHGLPGVDAASISSIKRNIESGRFPHQHFIGLFEKRLEDLGIDIAEAKAEEARRAQDVAPEPEPEPEPELEPPRTPGWMDHVPPRSTKHESHAQWDDSEEYRLACAELERLASPSSSPAGRKGLLALHLPPVSPRPPATAESAAKLLKQLASPLREAVNRKPRSEKEDEEAAAAAARIQAAYRGHLVRHTGDLLPELMVARLESRRREEQEGRETLMVTADRVVTAEQRLIAAEQAQALARAAYERAKRATEIVRAPLPVLREEKQTMLGVASKAESRAMIAEKAVIVEEQWRLKRAERMVVGDRKRRHNTAVSEVENRKGARDEAIRAAGAAKKAELIASFPLVVQRRLDVSRLEAQVDRLKAERKRARYVAMQNKVVDRGIYDLTRKGISKLGVYDQPGCVRTLETAPRRDSVHGLAWASDSVHLATIADETLYVWDAIKGVLKQQLGLPGGGVTRLSGLAFLGGRRGWLAHGATDGDHRITLVRVPCLSGRKKEAAELEAEPAVAIVHGAHSRQITDMVALRESAMGATEEGGESSSEGCRLLLTSSADQSCRLWDVEARKMVRGFVGHTRRINKISAPPDPSPHASSSAKRGEVGGAGGPFSNTFSSASADGTVKVWDPRQQQCVLTLAGHEANVTGVATFPGGGVLATCGDDGCCRVWDLRFATHTADREGPELMQLRTDMYGLSDGKAPPRTVEVRKGLTGVAWSCSGALLMASSDDRHIYGWEAFRVTSDEGATPPPCWALEGHTNRVSSLVVSPNGQAIASGGWDGLTKIWC